MPSPSTADAGIAATIRATFAQNRIPCLALNLIVGLLVGSYYAAPPVAAWWQQVGEFKTRWSFGFSLCATILAAVILPSIAQWMLGTLPRQHRARRILLLCLFWGYRGMEIDLFYRIQNRVFGSGADFGTLAKKVLVDQFVMSPLWFVPTYLVALRWVDLGGSWQRTLPTLDRSFWLRTCPTVMVTNWLVWIPALVLIYSLPPALQFPLFTVVMTFFILIVTFLARPAEKLMEQASVAP